LRCRNQVCQITGKYTGSCSTGSEFSACSFRLVLVHSKHSFVNGGSTIRCDISASCRCSLCIYGNISSYHGRSYCGCCELDYGAKCCSFAVGRVSCDIIKRPWSQVCQTAVKRSGSTGGGRNFGTRCLRIICCPEVNTLSVIVALPSDITFPPAVAVLCVNTVTAVVVTVVFERASVVNVTSSP
jgi:hypothetical protein